MKESEVEKYFVECVRKLTGRAYKFKCISQNGVSDRIACLPDGSTWFVELKKPNGRFRTLQEIFKQEVVELQQKYACLTSKQDVGTWYIQQRKRLLELQFKLPPDIYHATS